MVHGQRAFGQRRRDVGQVHGRRGSSRRCFGAFRVRCTFDFGSHLRCALYQDCQDFHPSVRRRQGYARDQRRSHPCFAQGDETHADQAARQRGAGCHDHHGRCRLRCRGRQHGRCVLYRRAGCDAGQGCRSDVEQFAVLYLEARSRYGHFDSYGRCTGRYLWQRHPVDA